MSRRALLLSALSWFLTYGFPSSFMAKFLSGGRVGFPGWLSLGSVLFFLDLDTLQIFTRIDPRIDSPKQF